MANSLKNEPRFQQQELINKFKSAQELDLN